MSYKRKGNEFHRTGRSGGWGNFLGDDSSRYGLGREELRLTLETVDGLNLQHHAANSMGNIDPLVKNIFKHFKHFNIDLESGNPVNLLDQILTSEHGSEHASSTKQKNTGVFRIVSEGDINSGRANVIIETGSRSLVRILSLLIESKQIDPSTSALILSAGLMQNRAYKYMVLEMLSFGYIQAVPEPVMDAARYLL